MCSSSVGLTASRPSFLSPIGFHLPERRLLRASRPVNQGRRAPPRPSRGFITGIPMARALASNLLPLRPGRAQRVPRAEHTLSLQLPPSRFMTVRSARSLQPAPHLRCRLLAAAASAPEGRKAARQAQLCAPRSPRPRPAARWHHAARALRPPAHAPLAAHVGAAVPGSRPPHHGPPGKCAPSRVPTCRGRPRSLAHILGGGGRGKGGVRLCPPSSPTTQSPVAEIKISPIVFPPPPILSCSTDSAYALIPPNCHWWFFSQCLFPVQFARRPLEVPPAS